MKVYERNCSKFTYPEQMKKILKYLNEHGSILVNESTIEDLYYEFSSQKYDASWMHVGQQMLVEFEEWLSELDI